MKNQYKRKFKSYPIPTFQKISMQQWNLFFKVKNRYKRFFKSKFRFFSLEVGRALSKRVLWQVSLFSKNQHLIDNVSILEQKTKQAHYLNDFQDNFLKQYTGNPKQMIYLKQLKNQRRKWAQQDLDMQEKNFIQNPLVMHTTAGVPLSISNQKPRFTFLHQFVGNNEISAYSNEKKLSLNRVMFRSAVLRKMWALQNTSLVPGSVWLKKSGKIPRAKMRAFKALSELFGNGNKKNVITNLKKLWSISLKTVPPLWFTASGIDSLKPTVLLKSGFQFSIPAASFAVSRKKVFVNGYNKNVPLSFCYPGDFVFVPFDSLFVNLISTGSSSNFEKGKVYTSVYTTLPFAWISPFFKNGALFLKKSSSNFKKEKRFFKKTFPKVTRVE